MPSFGSLMYTRYVYPPSEILAALGALPLAPPMLWLLFYYLAAGYGVFLLLTDLRCAFWAAVVGGAAFMLGPHLVSMGVFGHGSKLASVAYLPYLALLALRLRQPGRRALWIGLLALTVGLLLLRGHPQIAFYGLLMLGILGLVEIIGAWRRHVPRAEIGRFAGGLAGGVVLGGALAAALLLPVREYAPESIRGSSEGGGTAYQYATNWSLSPSEIATFFLPSAMGFGEGTYVGTMPFTNFPNYLGQACLLFGLAALLLLRGRLVSVLVALSVMALLVSFGRNLSFAYDLFYKFLPYFNKFRVPVMILVLLQFASSVLLGLGLSALWARLPRDAEWRRPPVLRDTTRLLIAATATAVFVVILVQPWSAALATRVAQNPRLPDQARSVYAEVARRLLQGDGLRVAAFLVAQASVVALLWRRKLPADVAGIALLGLTVLDLGAVDRRMVAPQHTWPGVTTRIGSERHADPQPGPLVRWLQSQPRDGAAPLRILPPGPGYMNNEWMQWGISSAGGYHPAKLSRFEDLVDTRKSNLDPRLRDLFAVRWIVLPPGQAMPEVKPAYDGPDGVVYENPDALPRAWVTGRWRTTTPGECKVQLLDPSFDRAHVALLEAPPQPAPDSAATGNAQVTAFAANRVTLTVQASAPALVVLAEAWHPGWRARVDGAPKPVWPRGLRAARRCGAGRELARRARVRRSFGAARHDDFARRAGAGARVAVRRLAQRPQSRRCGAGAGAMSASGRTPTAPSDAPGSPGAGSSSCRRTTKSRTSRGCCPRSWPRIRASTSWWWMTRRRTAPPVWCAVSSRSAVACI
jgi:hypothetical protein